MQTDRLRTIATRFVADAREDDIPGLAAELAYRFLFAVFPFGLFLAALGAFVAGLVGIDNPAEQVVAALGDNLPPDIAEGIRPELEQVIGNARPGLLTAGALGALWAATGGTNALIKAMNRAYDVEETRPLPIRLALAVALTILGGAGILVAFVTIVGGALLTEQVGERLGLGAVASGAVGVLRWPAAFAVLVIATATLFRLAPNLRPAWRWAVLGGVVFAIGWLVATWALAYYIGTFTNYGATYGSLGGVIVLMLWFYVTGMLLVGAARLTATTASVVEPEAIQRRRDDIARAVELREATRAAGRHAGRAMDRARSALGVERAEDGSPREDRRAGGATADRRSGSDRRAAERRLGPADRRGAPSSPAPSHGGRTPRITGGPERGASRP